MSKVYMPRKRAAVMLVTDFHLLLGAYQLHEINLSWQLPSTATHGGLKTFADVPKEHTHGGTLF